MRLTVNEKGLRSNRRLPANFDGVVGYSIDTPTIFEDVYTESQRTRFATFVRSSLAGKGDTRLDGINAVQSTIAGGAVIKYSA